MSERFHIRVAGDRLLFSAGHFITFGPGLCEPLHGHDYRLVVEVEGPLGESQYVVDFLAVQEIAAEVVAELDHRVLLPGEHPTLRVTASGGEVQVQYENRRWILPESDCRILSVANTTSELLARHIGQRIGTLLAARLKFQAQRLRVELTEGPGRGAVYEVDRRP